MKCSRWIIVLTVLVSSLVVNCWASNLAAEEFVIDTVAGTGSPENNGQEGPALTSNIGEPFGVEIGPDEALYITEVRHHRVRRLDLRNNTLTTVAGNGTRGYSGDGGIATSAQLNEPYEVRFDAGGNMYFVEMMNHLIRRVDARSRVITTLAGSPEAGFAGDGEPSVQARFRQPHSIALDGRGGLLVADIGNHRIRRIDLGAGTVSTIAGTGEKRLPIDGQPGLGNPILGPRALAVRDATLWIALREGNSIWTMDLDTGRMKHISGTGETGYEGDGKDPRTARYSGPKGIALDARGRAAIVDTENQVIRLLDPTNGFTRTTLSTIAGCGAKGGSGDGGRALAAQFDRPHGICIAANGTIYIGDTLNHRVRRLVRSEK